MDSNYTLRKLLYINDFDIIDSGVVHIGMHIKVSDQYLNIVNINENGCGVTCLSLDKEYTGEKNGDKIYVGHQTRQFSYDIDDLTPGISYYIRACATNSFNLTGPFSFSGYPGDVVSITPLDVPDPIINASMRSLSGTSIQIHFEPPPEIYPEGSNGMPINGYEIQVATGKNEIQVLTIDGKGSFISGGFRLVFRHEETDCLNIHNAGSTIGHSLEQLSAIDGINVSLSNTSGTFLQYSITFVGPHFSNGRQDKLQFLQSDCDIIYPENFSSSLNTIVEGVTRFTPYIFSIEIIAEGIVHGDFLISFGYRGLYNQLVVIENSTALFLK